MIRGNRPSISTVGRLQHVGRETRVSGWALGLCATRCSCHRHPVSHQLDILQDLTDGSLGLVSHRPGCTCCSPWTWQELEDVIRDLADIAALTHA